MSRPISPEQYEPSWQEPDEQLDCTCVHTCADDPASACSLSGDWHVHPDTYPGAGIFGPCPVHPDVEGDL